MAVEDRLVDRIVIRPIVYGNTAVCVHKPEKTGRYQTEASKRTHQWVLFLKPFGENHDMSVYVEKVEFKLHSTFTEPLRVCMEPPYEVHETGWGQFEAIITVHFRETLDRHSSV
ncbi:hypothetical protein ACOME3_000894 [Neoechinorhynchus agilis]